MKFVYIFTEMTKFTILICFSFSLRCLHLDLVWSREAGKLNNKLNIPFPNHSVFTNYNIIKVLKYVWIFL